MAPYAGTTRKKGDAGSTKKGGWESTFPAVFDKPSESALFMTRLLYISFSHILQSRRLVPSTAFKKRVIDDCIRSYVPNLKDPVGLRLSNKLRGASLAIEKGYLDELIIVVSPSEEEEDTAIEVFKWKMYYHENGECSAVILDAHDSERLSLRYTGLESSKKKTIAMLQAIRYLCCELLGPLPNTASASLMVTYTKAAPKGYQAEGFHRSPNMYQMDESARAVNVGAIPTAHHSCVLSVESVCVDDEYAIGAKLDDRLVNANLTLDSSMNDSFGGRNLDESMEQPPAHSPSGEAEITRGTGTVSDGLHDVSASAALEDSMQMNVRNLSTYPPTDSNAGSTKSTRSAQKKQKTPEPSVRVAKDDRSPAKRGRKRADREKSEKRTPGATKRVKMAMSPTVV